jgi:transcriptional regulator with XRE-family HTH domain
MQAINRHKKYTKEEDSMLEEWVSNQYQYKYMARKLGRDVNAIARRIERLAIGSKHLLSGTFSASELARIVGYSSSTVADIWINEQGLPAEKKAFMGEVKASTRYYIKADDFWKWAEPRKDSIRFSNIERGTLLPEPDWLHDQLKKQYYEPERRKYWTPAEDQRVWYLFYEKQMMQKDIAKEFGVSRISIQKRVAKIRAEKRGK